MIVIDLYRLIAWALLNGLGHRHLPDVWSIGIPVLRLDRLIRLFGAIPYTYMGNTPYRDMCGALSLQALLIPV